MKTCAFDGCGRTSRALGYCDSHYRQARYGNELHEIGAVGRAPLDGTVWKVRIRNERGSQPFYFSNEEQARHRAAIAFKAGTLVFFAKYELKEQIV